MNQILVIFEQLQGKLNRMSWEALVAAQQIGGQLSKPVEVVILGQGVRALAEETAVKAVSRVHLAEHALLEE